jgi:hypothetical protein
MQPLHPRGFSKGSLSVVPKHLNDPQHSLELHSISIETPEGEPR